MLSSTVSQLEEIIETDHEETTTHHDDDMLNIDDEMLNADLPQVFVEDGDVPDEENDDDDDDDADVIFYENQYGNPTGADSSTDLASSLVSTSSVLTSSITSSGMGTSSSYLQSSAFLEPLVEDDGDASSMMDNGHADDDDDDDAGEEDMEYEDMYGGDSSDISHQMSPRLSTYFNAMDRASTPSSSRQGGTSRQSFISSTASSRRVSTESEHTNQSAPPILVHSDSAPIGHDVASPPLQQRRVTIQANPDNRGNDSYLSGGTSSSSLMSRSSRFRISSRYGSNKSYNESNQNELNNRSKSSLYGSIINRRRSTRTINNNATGGNGNSNHQGSYLSSNDSNANTATAMVDAVERLNLYQSSDFEYVSAAAAVVTATLQNASGKRNYVQQFGQGDHVLVIVAVLGLADSFGDKELYTFDPVNKFGYPLGAGKTEAQNQGPFLYVLCVVKQVHFDEDERYYTVQRCDTNKEQRADPGYMEPIRDGDAIEVAYQAAQRTRKSMANQHEPITKQIGCFERWMKLMIQVGINVTHRFIPSYNRTRSGCKRLIQRLLHGEPGCALHLRFSGINFLVCCSMIFLFHDAFALGYLPASADFVVDTIGFSVWVVLVVELFLEFLIRPKNYQELVRSDRAFTPSTARILNRFHFVCESLSLLLYLPQSFCGLSGSCATTYGASRRTLLALTSTNFRQAFLGRFFVGLTFLRSFGLARHWKQMWLNHTYEKNDQDRSLIRQLLFVEKVQASRNIFRRKKDDDFNANGSEHSRSLGATKPIISEEDQQLENAACIGTSLMLVNSHRALFLITIIVCLLPAFYANLSRNPATWNQVHLLQDNNVASNTTEDCEYLFNAVQSWLYSSAIIQTHYTVIDNEFKDARLLWAQLLPVRCPWQQSSGVITTCDSFGTASIDAICDYWTMSTVPIPSREYFANSLDARSGGIVDHSLQTFAPANFDNNETFTDFQVRVFFNESHPISLANASLFLLLASMVIFGLLGLTVMRSDSERLVLSPLQHMLSIVVRYAENPLSTPSVKDSRRRHGSLFLQNDEDAEEQLGHYETEQLINAISKIADLLRKCWGVAGAGIISSNLARTKDGRTVVFNPTIPGKQIYALFGFIGINDFSKQLRSLEQDVMILINDVARVVHDEVYRWALGDSGQCNKNLGAAFLMVFRIGDFMEVHDKKRKATDVVFDSQLKSEKTRQRQGTTMERRLSSDGSIGRDGSLQLASLPGIQTFSDRALLGCLKSFAGLHRDQNMQEWQKDFRLGAGVGNFHISVIYGMDAGWAVEGAVGSEYKIDATYLSPHVNMASRMMSACAQYGVKVLLSQAVEELLSKTARTKLRHLDTVYVKGSNVAQRIYTYDARHEGVDFFLFERTPDQADIEAEAYSPSIWDNDQDLKSMRQHVTDDFMETFQLGVELYLEGQWKLACKSLEEADNVMFENVLESGFVDYITEDLGEYGKNLNISKEELQRLKNDFGDGACKCLIQYMQRRKYVPPPDWKGVRHLMSK